MVHDTQQTPHGGGSMIPPRGFKQEQYPLRHKIIYSFGLSAVTATQNSAYATLIMSSKDIVNAVGSIQVNPHNSEYETDTGPLVHKMSIIDKMNLSIRFNMTQYVLPTAYTSGLSGSEAFTGDGMQHIRLHWRPFFFSFPEKLDAADDDTTTTVAAILGLTKDSTNEDVVPLTTNKLPIQGTSDKSQPISTVYDTQAIADYNMTTDLTMEDHPWDETLFQEAIRRYTNKGALKACVGKTRTVNLSYRNPYKSFYISKFVPRAVRRIVPYTHMGIQINLPLISDIGQDYLASNGSGAVPHVGCKIICNYHEWHHEHDQSQGTPA